MKSRYSFSSRHTKRAKDLKNIRKQKQKYPKLVKDIVFKSDIILQVLDSRFIEETRNPELENLIEKKDKKIIYVLNKSDLLKDIEKTKRLVKHALFPYIFTSCSKRSRIKDLRNKIKQISKKVEEPIDKITNKVSVGIIGFPNTGKSSLINLLIGKSKAGTGSEAGFTRGLQKIKLSENIVLLDSPGIIPESQYSPAKKELIASHTKLSARSYSQVKEPEFVIAKIMKEYPNIFEKHYNLKLKSKRNAEELIEKVGKQKGLLKKGGEINEDKTARFILKEWQEGKIKV